MNNHGGYRTGAGRKRGKKTATINFRIESDVKKAVKEKYGKKLNKMFNDWIGEIEPVVFESREGLQSLCEYHHKGGKLIEGMPIILERSYRAKLSPAEFLTADIGSVVMDITGYGKYAESTCMIREDGEVKKWPFTMIYVSI